MFTWQHAFGEDTENGFVPIFDGKTFSGWEGDIQNSFRIQEGAIVGGNLRNRIPQNEFLATLKRYTDFELRLQVKLLGEGANAGIQFRTERIPDHLRLLIPSRYGAAILSFMTNLAAARFGWPSSKL